MQNVNMTSTTTNEKQITGKRLKRSLKTKKTSKEKRKPRKAILPDEDVEIQSDDEDSDELHEDVAKDGDVASSEDEETVEEKRLRLAKEYLAEIEANEMESRSEQEISRDVIAHRLRDDYVSWGLLESVSSVSAMSVKPGFTPDTLMAILKANPNRNQQLEKSGNLQRNVAHSYTTVKTEDISYLKGHKKSPTCLVLSSDDKLLFSTSKDGALIKWCVATGKRLKVVPLIGKQKDGDRVPDRLFGHTEPIMSLAVSTDGKFLASGSQDKTVIVWNPETMETIHTFGGHRKPVTGVVFRKGTYDLFSASEDRSVKVWNLTEMAFVESLFGHEDSISSIDALGRDRAVTSGCRDNTVRIWKIAEESQLVFFGHRGSIDCVRLINEEHFISCSDDGSIAVWGVSKKKPFVVVRQAHGLNSATNEPYWITSVAALHNSDLVASGSYDGYIRLWKCGLKFRNLSILQKIPMPGFISSLQFASDGSFLVAAVGKEHKSGRWWNFKEVFNCVCMIPLKKVH